MSQAAAEMPQQSTEPQSLLSEATAPEWINPTQPEIFDDREAQTTSSYLIDGENPVPVEIIAALPDKELTAARNELMKKIYLPTSESTPQQRELFDAIEQVGQDRLDRERRRDALQYIGTMALALAWAYWGAPINPNKDTRVLEALAFEGTYIVGKTIKTVAKTIYDVSSQGRSNRAEAVKTSNDGREEIA